MSCTHLKTKKFKVRNLSNSFQRTTQARCGNWLKVWKGMNNGIDIRSLVSSYKKFPEIRLGTKGYNKNSRMGGHHSVQSG
jgi:hypothetical protein